MSKDQITKIATEIKDAGVSKVNQASSSAKKVVNKIKNEGNKMKAITEDNAYELGKSARKALDLTAKSAYSSTDYVKKQTRERPMLAIGLSVMVGMILAKLLSNKNCG